MFKPFLFIPAILLFFISCAGNSKKEAADTKSSPPYEHGYIVKVGDYAPDFLAYTLTGEQFQLAALREDVVMLQFTASWCGVCRKEMPAIESEIWQRYRYHPGFSLYAVDLKEPRDKIISFIDDTKITYPVLLDHDGKIFGLYAEEDAGVTRNVIINQEGKIAMLTRLYERDEFERMIQCIDSLLHIR